MTPKSKIAEFKRLLAMTREINRLNLVLLEVRKVHLMTGGGGSSWRLALDAMARRVASRRRKRPRTGVVAGTTVDDDLGDDAAVCPLTPRRIPNYCNSTWLLVRGLPWAKMWRACGASVCCL